jgi:soluble lytic murein transglycosylase-like protein
MANQMIALQTRNPQLPDPSKMTSQYATMMNLAQQNETSRRQGLQAQQAMDIKAAEEARAIEMQGPALSEAGSKATSAMLKTAMEFNNFVRTALSVADTPDQIPELAARIARQPQFQDEMFQGSLQEAVASLPRDPSQFEAWKEKTALSTLAADKRYEQEFQKQTTGAEERIISMPKYGRGAATEVPGSRIQAAEGMQYIKDDQGNVRVVPKETAGSFGTPAPAVGTRPSMGAPGTGKETFKIMIGMESRGKQFDKSGAPLTSPKGAIGIAQIMPATAPEAAKLAGLPYDITRLKNDEAYNYALGEAYFEKQLRDFGGDARKAAAAYNAGPGAVRRAISKGGPDGWINHVPRETRDYVAAVTGGGNRQTATAGTGEPPIVVKGSNTKANQALTAKDAAVARYDETITVAKRLLTNPGLNSIIGNIQGNIPETVLSLYSQDAADALADYNTLLTTAGFQELQAMRDASPTGGALGQVAVEENRMLQKSAFASSRTQAEAKFKQAVKDYISRMERSRNRVVSAFDRQFGERVNSSPPAAPRAAAPSGARPAAATRTPVTPSGGWGKAKVVGN